VSLEKLGMVQTLDDDFQSMRSCMVGKENMMHAQKVKSNVFFCSREVSCKVNFDAGNFDMRKINQI
jgi:hypothetical protein